MICVCPVALCACLPLVASAAAMARGAAFVPPDLAPRWLPLPSVVTADACRNCAGTQAADAEEARKQALVTDAMTSGKNTHSIAVPAGEERTEKKAKTSEK